MNTQHTPGPWTAELQTDIDAEGNGYAWAIRAPRPHPRYEQNPAYANSESNARLIAAAPELLEVLESLHYAAHGYAHGDTGEAFTFDALIGQLEGARAAIAKAKGE